MTVSSVTAGSPSAERTKSLTRRLSPSETYSADPTLTASRTPTKETLSPSQFRSATRTRTRTGLSNTASILGFVAAVASYVPLQPTVVLPITVTLTACPTYVSGDVAYLVQLPSTGGLCSDRVRNRNASLLRFVSGNVTLPVVFQGAVRAVGAYELCVYSATKREWAIIKPTPYLFASPYVVPNTITPRVHATSGIIQFRMTVYGAAATDHVLILPTVLSTAKAPCDPTVLNAVKFNAFVQVSNVSFSSRQQVDASGDVTVCYWGAPYIFYRLVQPRWRIEGRIDSIISNHSDSFVATYAPFTFDVVGAGLSTRDQVMFANGSSCSKAQALVAGRHFSHQVLTNPTMIPSLRMVSHAVTFFAPLPQVSLCLKSNASNYFSRAAQWEVPFTRATSATPLNVTVASGAFVNFSFATDAGTLDPRYDAAFLCIGDTCGCSRSANPLSFNTSNWQWEGFAPHLIATASSIGSICYATNTSLAWSLQPTTHFTLRRFLHVPDQLLPVLSGQPRGMFLNSDGLNLSLLQVFVALSAASCSAPVSAVPASVASLVIQFSLGYVEVTPHRVRPMYLCALDMEHGAVFASQQITVLPVSPSGFAPNEFFSNTSSQITFFPADGSTFSFLEANTSLIPCSELTPRFVVEAVLNATTLRIRFLSMTAADVMENAFCFSIRNSSSNKPILLPISQAQTGVLRVNPLLTAAAISGSLFTQTTGSITVILTGYDLESQFITIVPCSTSPLLNVNLIDNSSTELDNVTVWTSTYDLDSAVTATYLICFFYARSPAVISTLNVSGIPLVITFDSVAIAAAQLPSAPHPVTINPLLNVFSLSVAASDRRGVFSSVKAVRYVAASVSPCDEPSLPLYPLNTSVGIWRYDLKTRNVLRGSVLLCYRSLTSQWYLFNSSNDFFNQALVLQSSFSISTPTVGPAVYETCEASLQISGYQLDGSTDTFFTVPAGDDCSQHNSSTSNSTTPLPVVALQRDTTNLANLVNMSFSYIFPVVGSLLLCTLLGRGTAGVLVGAFAVQNPLVLTGGNTLQLACQSKLVLTSPVAVAYEYDFLIGNSNEYLPLADVTSASTLTVAALPATNFIARMTVLQPSLGNTILLNVTRSFNNTQTLPTIRSQVIYCAKLTQSVVGEATRDFAAAVIYLSSYRDATCGNRFLDGTISNSPSAVLNAAVALVNVQPQLIWDGQYFLGLLGYLAQFDRNPAAQMTMLMNLTSPLTLYSGNVSNTLSGQLALVNEVSNYLVNSGGRTALALLVMQRVVDVYQVCCQYLPSGERIAAQSSNTAMGIGNGVALTTVNIGGGAFAMLPLPANVTTPACRGVAVLPTFLQGTSSATANRRSSSTSTDPQFNLSTAVLMSDSPISSFSVGYSWNSSSVDAVNGYRFYPTDASSFRSSSGGVWAPQQSLSFNYQSPELTIQVSASPATGTFAVFSGIAVKFTVDPLAARLQREKDTMTTTGYYILLAILLFQFVGLFVSAWFDRWNNSRRLKAARDFVYGLKSQDPNFFQAHRLFSLFTDLNISLTPSEQTVMLQKAGDEPLRNGGEPVVALQGPSFHPTHCISTVAKHALLCMHLFCLALATCFTLRYDVASQVPFLLADWVGFGIVSAVFAWPLSVWTRVVLLRTQRDIASMAATVAAFGGCIIAALVSSKDLLSMIAVLLAVGLFVFSLVVAFARQWWSTLHFIHVNVVVRAVGSVLFIAAELSAIIVLFFVPYFSDRLTVYTSRPYLGSDPANPDGSGLWKSFCFAAVVDIFVFETFKAIFLYKLHQATNTARWNAAARRLHAPTDGGSAIGSVTKRLSTYSLDPPTKSLPKNIEELYGDSEVKEVDSFNLPPSTSFHYDPNAGLIEEVASEFDDVESNEFEAVLPVTTEVFTEPFADIPHTQSTVTSAVVAPQPNPLRESELWNWRQPDNRRSLRIAPTVASQQPPPSASFRLSSTPRRQGPTSPVSASDFDYLDESS